MFNLAIIDDEEDTGPIYRVYFRKEIREEKVKLHHFISGELFFESLKDKDLKFDLILCDINMPNMNGFEVLDKIRDLKLNTPVYMISAYESDEYIQKSLEKGALKFMGKPIDIEKLKCYLQLD